MEHFFLPGLDIWLVSEDEFPFMSRGCCCSDLSCCGSAATATSTAIIIVLGDAFVSLSCVHCPHFETTCKLVGSWASLRKPQLCAKVSLSGSSLGQQLFTSTHTAQQTRDQSYSLTETGHNELDTVSRHLLLKRK